MAFVLSEPMGGRRFQIGIDHHALHTHLPNFASSDNIESSESIYSCWPSHIASSVKTERLSGKRKLARREKGAFCDLFIQ